MEVCYMNEQNTKLESIKKRCLTAEKIVKILRGLVIAGAVIALICGFIITGCADTVNPELVKQVESGNMTIETSIRFQGIFKLFIPLNEYYAPNDYAHPLGISCIVIGCVFILEAVILTFIIKIFTILKEENNPFSERSMKQLKTSFIAITVTVFLTSSIGPGLIVGLILFCIYSIFEYGAALQTEIDETL